MGRLYLIWLLVQYRSKSDENLKVDYNGNKLEINEPDALASQLETLRLQLLADPYFQNVPSMQPKTGKTALAFHAKDDVAEVRREVFAVLRNQPDLRFFAVVRDKRSLLEYVRQQNAHDLMYRYHPNELYDYLVRRLFRDRLHQYDEYDIYFSKRGEIRPHGCAPDRPRVCPPSIPGEVGQSLECADADCSGDSCPTRRIASR